MTKSCGSNGLFIIFICNLVYLVHFIMNYNPERINHRVKLINVFILMELSMAFTHRIQVDTCLSFRFEGCRLFREKCIYLFVAVFLMWCLSKYVRKVVVLDIVSWDVVASDRVSTNNLCLKLVSHLVSNNRCICRYRWFKISIKY